MKGRIFILYMLLVAIVSGSCKHKDLCIDHNHGDNLVLKVNWYLKWNLEYLKDWDTEWNPDWIIDWNKVIPTKPEGVRLVAETGTDSYRHILNLSPEGGDVKLQPGDYTALLYNNDTEYIVYKESERVANTMATTRARSRSPYSENNPEENTVNAPDFLFCSFIDRLHVEGAVGEDSGGSRSVFEVDITMYPVVFSYIIRFEFNSGKEYINDARIALSGMAGTVNLSNRRTLDDVVTVLYDEAEVCDYGVEVVLRSFGMCNFDPVPTDEYPNGHFYDPGEMETEGKPAVTDRPKYDGQTRNMLTLEVALKSGQVKTFEVDVTDSMLEQPRGGVLLIENLEITPEEGEGSQTGGFEVDVDDWGDSEDIDVPL